MRGIETQYCFYSVFKSLLACMQMQIAGRYYHALFLKGNIMTKTTQQMYINPNLFGVDTPQMYCGGGGLPFPFFCQCIEKNALGDDGYVFLTR